jgi:UDP-GlcNAc:undecaprenyl-phosphate GlcNAc-1-phosphate transferase
MDILQVIPVRIHKKLPLPGPDKEHFHHQLGKLGFRHVEVVVIIYLLQTILMAGAFWLRYESDLAVALFYAAFVCAILGALLLGNAKHWQFRQKQRAAAVTRERRNRYLRRFNWYYHQSGRLIAVMLGLFFIAAGWRLGDHSGLVAAGASMALVFAVGSVAARSRYSGTVFRIILYCACVFFAYHIAGSHLVLEQEYWLISYMLALIICLVVAIRMTRKQEFALTTQDLLILLVVVLVPLMPFEALDEYAIGGIALIVAVLMYTSEFVLIRGTRMVAFAAACAMGGILLVLPLGNNW